ncbi:MAG TPA: hypothetical protein DCE41_23370, partial [Cytophagales bacterium]|nr:hypothetical protein [Cytophagales bacterium]
MKTTRIQFFGLCLLLLGAVAFPSWAQVGPVLWQEDFTRIDANVWTFETGNGDWGWGNGELEYYQTD